MGSVPVQRDSGGKGSQWGGQPVLQVRRLQCLAGRSRYPRWALRVWKDQEGWSLMTIEQLPIRVQPPAQPLSLCVAFLRAGDQQWAPIFFHRIRKGSWDPGLSDKLPFTTGDPK